MLTVQKEVAISRLWLGGGLGLVVFLVILAGMGLAAGTGVDFQLGGGVTPLVPGTAQILADPGHPGPDWSDLFNSDRTLRDEYPGPSGNGVPDYVELYGGQWGVIMTDDVSLGVAMDTTTLVGSDGLVYRGTAAASHDIGNAYVYSTFDSAGDLVVYAGAERLGSGDSFLEIELNQGHIRLGHGPPWRVVGERAVGDVLARLTFQGGGISSLVIQTWTEVEPGQYAYETIESVVGESCNTAGTVCVVSNGTTVDGGPWSNFDTVGDPEIISAARFVELGVNVGALLDWQPDYMSIQIRSPEDVTFGYFPEGN
jgi:hypothetical protein